MDVPYQHPIAQKNPLVRSCPVVGSFHAQSNKAIQGPAVFNFTFFSSQPILKVRPVRLQIAPSFSLFHLVVAASDPPRDLKLPNRATWLVLPQDITPTMAGRARPVPSMAPMISLAVIRVRGRRNFPPPTPLRCMSLPQERDISHLAQSFPIILHMFL